MPPFWETTRLEDMNQDQWESLCDGCGRCCLNKLEDTDTHEICFTNVACTLLDAQSCRCRHYNKRHRYVPDCLVLTPQTVFENPSLPSSCAYRRLAEGRPLAAWHPLLSEQPDTVHGAGVSVRGRTLSEDHVHEEQLEDHIVDWFDGD